VILASRREGKWGKGLRDEMDVWKDISRGGSVMGCMEYCMELGILEAMVAVIVVSKSARRVFAKGLFV
jgi:hypothetical protein